MIRRSRGHVSGHRPGTHCLSELLLLYIGVLASGEIRSFCEYVDRRHGRVELTDRSEAEAISSALDKVTAHLWYVGQSPMPFDFVSHANRVTWRVWKVGDDRPEAPRPPRDFEEAELAYYADPLERLHRLHTGGPEMTTGFGHDPQW